jgi:prepilin-type processing-associated H-X9-DG protein
LTTGAYQDLPAVYHNNASSFSFADGHAEIHVWRDGKFIALTTGGGSLPGSPDVYWLVSHATSP